VNKISTTEASRLWVFRCDRAQGTATWRWDCRARDGSVIRTSSESFHSLRAAIDDAREHGLSA
jgi:hypothetical protein